MSAARRLPVVLGLLGLMACSSPSGGLYLSITSDNTLSASSLLVRALVSSDGQDVSYEQSFSIAGRDLKASPYVVKVTVHGFADGTEARLSVMALAQGRALATYAGRQALSTDDLVQVVLADIDDGCDADGDGYKACVQKPQCCSDDEKNDAADCDDADPDGNPFAGTKACRVCSAECGAVEGDASRDVVGPNDVTDVDTADRAGGAEDVKPADVPEAERPLDTIDAPDVRDATVAFDARDTLDAGDATDVPDASDVVETETETPAPSEVEEDACTPDCTGAVCGDDGCGDSCGSCLTGKACVLGACVCPDECGPVGMKECTDGTHFKTCGDPDGDTCLEWTLPSACDAGSTCDSGNCTCTPDCTGKACGGDGCGGSCGSCTNNKACTFGQCVCAGTTDDDCDGVDDDCDGVADQGFVATPTACGKGACLRTGATTCMGGVLGDTCLPGSPAANDATCNGVDDDCDGLTDEHYAPITSCFKQGACAAANKASSCAGGVETACKTGTPTASDATCNGIDDDCDGSFDEDYPPVSTCFKLGACSAANKASSCSAGVETACKTGTPAASDASCNGSDDDCDGDTDEDYSPASTSCGVGACAAVGTTSCVAGQVKDSCTVGTPNCSSSECGDDGCGGTCGTCPDAGGSCTTTTCVSGHCEQIPILGCCTVDVDCSAQQICILDDSSAGHCESTCVTGCPAGCGWQAFDGCHCKVYPTGAKNYTDQGATVTDVLTGLVWAKAPASSTKTWADAKAWCNTNQQGLPGTGWRLPTLRELVGLLDLSVSDWPIWNQAVFGQSLGPSQNYWSDTPMSSSASYIVAFHLGLAAFDNTDAVWSVRCVRGGAVGPVVQNRFVEKRDATVYDRVTGLTWQVTPALDKTWNDAKTYCETNAAGITGTGWRLPDLFELQSLADYENYPAKCPMWDTTFGALCPTFPWFLSVTPFWSSGSSPLLVSFLNGTTGGGGNGGVRCVRSEP